MRKEVENQTNTEFVTELMEFSRHGALTQLFVIDAITKHAERVAAAPPMEHALIDGDAWKSCAIEVRNRLNEKYGPLAKGETTT